MPNRSLRDLIDIPPVWLFAALCLTWGIGEVLPGPEVGVVLWWIGIFLIGAGLVIIFAALFAFFRARTSPIPRDTPNTLLTGGIFALTRNPIYLGDVLVLTGFALKWDAVLALFLVPLFMAVIQRRFILPEEEKNKDLFKTGYAEYAGRVRRWV
ncbi:MAG: isoprenylcysteine carboxylmethyltransferase family protein [Pseudomonadota bacterium]|nr:isoprenylcysteine carboxylmethyltransferase family protein [Pseudomonadota bacterium]MEC8794898.1 isoprenylcysteine carboxylmethyltransferase family protein [Pseudomonadota bacterium]